jgi:hypothetical protein
MHTNVRAARSPSHSVLASSCAAAPGSVLCSLCEDAGRHRQVGRLTTRQLKPAAGRCDKQRRRALKQSMFDGCDLCCNIR